MKYSEVFKEFTSRCDLVLEKPDAEEAAKNADIVFLCLPHTVSMEYLPRIVKKKRKVIDISADYRLKDVSLYKKFYGKIHKDRKNLKLAIYGLPEVYKQEIGRANIVANPGCYSTCCILGSYPLVKYKLIKGDIFVDAKSGISGAGRKPKVELSFCEIDGNIKCYKPFVHQHTPEIEQILQREVVFVPHLVSIQDGIMCTMVMRLSSEIKSKSIARAFSFYENSPFVRVYHDGYLPTIKDVVGTNFCDIGYRIERDRLIVVSCIDN
ncbi:MAG: N-acetyl-gamma-glutamyl-phosphate reductase, partial [Candidatus Latescibacterota bacterium]